MEEKAKYFKNKDHIDDPNLLWSAFSEMPALSDDFTEQLEWALMYLSFQDSMYDFREGEKQFRLNTFDGAWLFGLDRLGDGEGAMKFINPDWEQVTPDFFPEMNLKEFYLKSKDGNANYLYQVKVIPYKERRHLQQYRNVIRVREGLLTKNEKWYLSENYYHLDLIDPKGTLSKLGEGIGKFLPVLISFDPNYQYREKDYFDHYLKDPDPMGVKSLADLTKRINWSFNAKLTSYYEWFIYIRETDKSIGFKIPINPSSSKEIFALRDTPEGGTRRKAICNFVREHMRTIKKDDMANDEVQTIVKRHMRGETKFNWRGLQVNVIPSEYDIKRVGSKKKKYLEV